MFVVMESIGWLIVVLVDFGSYGNSWVVMRKCFVVFGLSFLFCVERIDRLYWLVIC